MKNIKISNHHHHPGLLTAVLWGAASRICSKQRAVFLCTSHLAFFLRLFIRA